VNKKEDEETALRGEQQAWMPLGFESDGQDDAPAKPPHPPAMRVGGKRVPLPKVSSKMSDENEMRDEAEMRMTKNMI